MAESDGQTGLQANSYHMIRVSSNHTDTYLSDKEVQDAASEGG